MIATDIDIDFADKDAALMGLDTIAAIQNTRNNGIVRHPSGVYFQNIPTHPITGMASMEYEEAERLGYFKVDFLNQSVYVDVKDEQHLDELLNTEPPWELLEERAFVEQLTHIHNHYGTVLRIKPTSIDDLAIVLALIRPGKKHLVYMQRDAIEAEIWKPSHDGYVFRKAHAISYAALIVVQMNLIVEKLYAKINEEPNDYLAI
jgi:hypothetical protein